VPGRARSGARRGGAEESWDRAIAAADARAGPELRLARAGTWLKLGDYRRAVAEVEGLAGTARDRPGPRRYDMACLLARAAAATGQDRSLDPAARRALADRLAAGALVELRHARDAGSFRGSDRIRYMDTDPDLDALRGREDFRDLRLDLAFPLDPFGR
jgi:hypothetical protein